jgi:glutamate dehydrogenase/leucine dehydrogenase
MFDALQLMDDGGPEKVVCVSDRKSGMRGVLVIDNSARGVGRRGTRMSTGLSVLEVARLARTMTWKWAGGNMPTTPAGLEVSAARGVTVVPDFVANAGGIAAAAHSMDARYSRFTVDSADVLPTISTKMRQNTVTVLTEARSSNLTTHAEARELAQDRVRTAMILRGQIPAHGR